MLSLLFTTLLALFLLLLHVGSIFAFTHFFDVKLFLTALFLWQFFGSIGISICYHREITHKAFKSSLPIRLFHLICAMLAGQAGPIMWAQVHRIHHKYSDREGDPHSPNKGLINAHFGWIFQQKERKKNKDFLVLPKDLANDPLLRFFQYMHFPSLIIVFVLLYKTGGMSYLLWLGCFRITLTLHSAWVINSLGHFWGYQNYPGSDQSKNNKFIALFTFGEGFHNNHHKRPSSINMGHRKDEIDFGYYYILLLEKLKLVSKVKK